MLRGHASQPAHVGRRAPRAVILEFGPGGSVRGLQAGEIGRACRAEAAGCEGLQQEGRWSVEKLGVAHAVALGER